MKILFIKVLLLLVLCKVQAHDKVVLWGQVRDSDGHPIEQAVVCIANSSIGVVTNREGSYRLPLTPGEYRISVTSLGYSEFQQLITINQSLQLNVILSTENIKLESIEIQAKSKSQQMRETVFAINALDVKSLSAAQTNLAEIVGRSTGINMRREGGMGSNFDLSINGQKKLRQFQVGRCKYDFTNGFDDLHVESYRRILAGKGFGLSDARPAIELCEKLSAS